GAVDGSFRPGAVEVLHGGGSWAGDSLDRGDTRTGRRRVLVPGPIRHLLRRAMARRRPPTAAIGVGSAAPPPPTPATGPRRRAAKELRKLRREGWHVRHDLDDAYGNLDHVLVGPSGCFCSIRRTYSGT